MIKVLLSGILLVIFSFSSLSQELEEEWLEWGAVYDNLGFATGHSHCMIATDFNLEGEVRYLKGIEYNSSTVSDPNGNIFSFSQELKKTSPINKVKTKAKL